MVKTPRTRIQTMPTDRERIARIIEPAAWAEHDDLAAIPPTDEDDPRLFDPWTGRLDASLAKADQILALRPDGGGVPAGWWMAPDQLTDKMKAALPAWIVRESVFPDIAEKIWQRMQDAAPSPPEGEG
jgi:hypothetical protein